MNASDSAGPNGAPTAGSDPSSQTDGGPAESPSASAGEGLTVEALATKLDEIAGRMETRSKTLERDMARFRKQSRGEEWVEDKPKSGNGAAPPKADVDMDLIRAEVRLDLLVESLPENLQSEVNEAREELGAKAALRVADALRRVQQAGNAADTHTQQPPVRAGNPAQPAVRTEISMSDLDALPRAEQDEFLARVRKGEAIILT